jgi:hypothetical protein
LNDFIESQQAKFTETLEAGTAITPTAFGKHPIIALTAKRFPDDSFKELKGRPTVRDDQRIEMTDGIVEAISGEFDARIKKVVPGTLSIRMNRSEDRLIKPLREGLMSCIIAALELKGGEHNGPANEGSTRSSSIPEDTPQGWPQEGFIIWDFGPPAAPEGDEQDIVPMMAAEYHALSKAMRSLLPIWELIVKATGIQLALVELLIELTKHDLVNPEPLWKLACGW